MAVIENPGVLLYSRIRKSPYFYASRRHGVAALQRLQPHVSPRHYGDPGRGVLAPAERRHALGRRRREADRDQRARRLRRSPSCSSRATSTSAPSSSASTCSYAARRRDHQRPGAPARRGEPLLALARRQRRGAVGARRRLQRRLRRRDQGARRRPGAGAGAEVQGRDGRPLRRHILDIPYYYMRPYELDGMRMLVSRTGYTAELGYEIYLYDAYRDGDKLWDAVLEAGEPHGLEVIGPCHIRRIEGGILALGCDMWYDTNPYEVGMGYRLDGRPRAGVGLHRQGRARDESSGGPEADARRASRSAARASAPTTTAR